MDPMLFFIGSLLCFLGIGDCPTDEPIVIEHGIKYDTLNDLNMLLSIYESTDNQDGGKSLGFVTINGVNPRNDSVKSCLEINDEIIDCSSWQSKDDYIPCRYFDGTWNKKTDEQIRAGYCIGISTLDYVNKLDELRESNVARHLQDVGVFKDIPLELIVEGMPKSQDSVIVEKLDELIRLQKIHNDYHKNKDNSLHFTPTFDSTIVMTDEVPDECYYEKKQLGSFDSGMPFYYFKLINCELKDGKYELIEKMESTE